MIKSNAILSKYLTNKIKRTETIVKGLNQLLTSYDQLQKLDATLVDYKIKTGTILNYISVAPLFIMLVSGVICLGLSAVYHLFHI